MTLIAFGGVKGGPGVTTLAWVVAAALAERYPTVLLELDPDGGAIAARTRRPVDPGLRSLAVAGRRTPLTTDLMTRHAQSIGRLPVVLADPAAATVQTSLTELSSLGSAAATQPGVWVADAGRLSHHPTVAGSAQLVALVTSAAPAELAAAWAWLQGRRPEDRPVVVVPASGDAARLAADLGTTVLATGPPWDPTAVELLHAGTAMEDRRLHRRDLTRWARWASQVFIAAATREPAAR